MLAEGRTEEDAGIEVSVDEGSSFFELDDADGRKVELSSRTCSCVHSHARL
jgi:hypothetical protein